jgi:hypothetical protein
MYIKDHKLIEMEGRFTPPLVIPGLRGFRAVNGLGMCNLANWRIAGGRLFIVLTDNYGGTCEVDLEATAPAMGFLAMADIVSTLGAAAALDQQIATSYVYATRALWKNF